MHYECFMTAITISIIITTCEDVEVKMYIFFPCSTCHSTLLTKERVIPQYVVVNKSVSMQHLAFRFTLLTDLG